MNEEHPKKRPSCLGVLAAIGTILGVLLAILTGLNNLVELLLKLPQHVVLQISGVQISIGVTIFIALLILVLMGLSFTVGMFYPVYFVGELFTKRKPPLFFRPFEVLSYPFLYLADWIVGWKYKAFLERRPPSELKKRLSASSQEVPPQEQKEKKGG